MNIEDGIRELEAAGLRAFPALEEAPRDGWLLRFANGHARRANSVQPTSYTGENLPESIVAAETWYRERGLVCTFRLTPISAPAGIDAHLAASGYHRQDPTAVMTRQLGEALTVDKRVEFAAEPTEVWFDTILGSNRYMQGRRPTLERTLRKIEPPAAFAVLRQAGQVVATGLAVADGNLVGLFNIATLPEFRRQGLGRLISETLLAWGRERGAERGYLQVMRNNTPAWKLYEEMGFERIYDYWYRCPEDRPPMQA